MGGQERQYAGLYSDCSVVKNRALYVLRVIAGLVPDDPRVENDPRVVALEWLKVHGVDRPLMPFLEEV